MDFGFWIADFGLKTNRLTQGSASFPKIRIPFWILDQGITALGTASFPNSAFQSKIQPIWILDCHTTAIPWLRFLARFFNPKSKI